MSSVCRACGWIARFQLPWQLGLGQFQDNTPRCAGDCYGGSNTPLWIFLFVFCLLTCLSEWLWCTRIPLPHIKKMETKNWGWKKKGVGITGWFPQARHLGGQFFSFFLFPFMSHRPWSQSLLQDAIQSVSSEILPGPHISGHSAEYRQSLMTTCLLRFYVAVSQLIGNTEVCMGLV